MPSPISVSLIAGLSDADVSAVLHQLGTRVSLHGLEAAQLVHVDDDVDDEVALRTLRDAASQAAARGETLTIRATTESLASLIDLIMMMKSQAEAPALELASVLSVLDAEHVLRDLEAADFLRERNAAVDADDDRTIADVLIEHIETASTIVLCHTERLDEAARAALIGLLHALNPQAERVEWVPQALDTARSLSHHYDVDAVEAGAGWATLLRGADVPLSAGVSAFTYCRRRPFHPQRLFDLMHSDWLRMHGIVWRSRGYFWLASRMDLSGSWEQAGGACRHGAAGVWWSATDHDDWPDDQALRADIALRLQDGDAPAPYGDRMQELAFIGIHVDEAAIVAQLDACLLTDAEMAAGPAAWAALPDPFPQWEADDHAHEHTHDHVCDADCGHTH